jgi:hypothetical protein
MNTYKQKPDKRVLLRTWILGLAVTSLLAGCGGGPDQRVGGNSRIPIDYTDTRLNLSCQNVGIAFEQCVLDDFENPFRGVEIREFNINNPGAENKFDLVNSIPQPGDTDPDTGLPYPVGTGAKARFYLWATALARSPSGENQWYTARALHELWDAAGDPIVQNQALRTYRAQLDFFFGTVTFFTCCENVDPNGEPVPFSVTLNEQTADALYRTEATGWRRLVPGDPLLAQSLLAEWGYTYQPATPPNFNNGVVSLSIFP